MAVVRSSDFLRASKRATALATLVRQRRLTPSCGEHASTAERTVGPARMIVESLTPRPGIREHNRVRSGSPVRAQSLISRRCCCHDEEVLINTNPHNEALTVAHSRRATDIIFQG